MSEEVSGAECMQLAEGSADDDLAASLKQQGNERLKAGDAQGALDLYSRGLEAARGVELRGLLHSNCAHVLLKLPGKEEEALVHCDAAIECDASNVKAYWRGATASQRLERHSVTIGYCTRGLSIDRNNKELKLMLKKSKALAGFDVEAARREKADADRLLQEGRASDALARYTSLLEAISEQQSTSPTGSSGTVEELRRGVLERKAACHLELGEWWPAVRAVELAAAYCDQQPPDVAFCEGRALRELGLLHSAEEKFRHAAKQCHTTTEDSSPGDDADRPTPSSSSSSAAQEAHAEVTAVLTAVEEGQSEVIMSEIERLRKALSEKEAVNWMYTVKVRCESEEGRQEMLGNGFLKPEWLALPQPTYTARCMQKLLLYQVKKKLQQELSILPTPKSAGQGPRPGLGVQYTFAAPASLRHANAGLILRDRHIEELRSRGLTVIDQAFDDEAMSRMRGECEWLDKKMGILLQDDEDVCNPLQRRFDIPLADRERVEASRADTPVLFQVIDHLRGLPVVLEERLGLQLRVPETLMLACYPKGAFYRKHLDSYEGKDIPRKVTILLYCNPDWVPGDGGALRAWIGGEPVEFDPKAGRIILFMSQDIWHEVTESHKERYALTQWVWDVKKDSLGR